MLEAGDIYPSQSPWCNAIMLVRKKDRGLCFCIDSCKLEHKDQKGLLSTTPHTRGHWESNVGAGYFSCLDLIAGFWQITMEKGSKQYTAFTVGNLGLFQVWMNDHLGLCHAPTTLLEVNAELSGWIEPNILFNLLGWCDCLFRNQGSAFVNACVLCLNTFWEHNLKLKLS